MENKHTNEIDSPIIDSNAEIAATEELPDEVAEALKDIPEAQKRTIEEHMFSFMQMRSSVSSPETEVMKKLTSEHLTTYMDIMREDMHKGYEEKKHNRIISVIVLTLIMVFIIAVIIILKSNPDVMEKVIYAAGGLIAGSIGGYGLGKRKS